MATLYAHASTGALLRLLSTDAEEAQFPTPPEGAGPPLTFDAVSNTALLADLRAVTSSYRFSGGTLTKNGQPITIAPDSPETTEKKALRALMGKTTFTQTERDRIAAFALKTLAQLGHL